MCLVSMFYDTCSHMDIDYSDVTSLLVSFNCLLNMVTFFRNGTRMHILFIKYLTNLIIRSMKKQIVTILVSRWNRILKK